MLKLISAPFHPTLEEEFRQRIVQRKKEPLTPLAVVTSSSRLMSRLMRMLAEGGLPLLNVHFHTFSSFTESLVSSDTTALKPVLSDPLFYDMLIKIILRDDRPFSEMSDLAVPDGFPPAVRSTLRDLMDAGVPKNAGELFQEAKGFDLFKSELDIGQLLELLRVYRIYCEKLEELPISPRSDLLKFAAEAAPSSRFLRKFDEVLFYGFYDLTGLQTELFEAVTKAVPSVLFFPFVQGDHDYRFASKFRDTILQKLTQDELKPDIKVPKKPDVEVFSVSGQDDEAWLVATQILRLHEEKKIPFHEIAVVARTRERLQDTFPRILEEHLIPYAGSLKSTLRGAPQRAVALRFLMEMESYPETEFSIDVKQFPEFHGDNLLKRQTQKEAWPRFAAWGAWITRAKADVETAFDPISDDSRRIWDAMIEALSSLQVFDQAFPNVSWDDFLSALKDRWDEWPLPQPKEHEAGVSLLHAEAARGLSFQAVFLVGMEEKGFPRLIREDPFLRDDARLALETMFGYKIHTKMGGLDEEKLLFRLMTEAAREHLAMVYQRSDEEGKVVGMSSFVRAYLAGREISEDLIQIVPRPTFARLHQAKFSHLGLRDLTVRLLRDGQTKEAMELLKKTGSSCLDPQALKSAQSLNAYEDAGAFDGVIPDKEAQEFLAKHALSPTALEDFARCPFQFYSKHVLRVRPLEEEPSLEELEPKEMGKLVHSFFEGYYKMRMDSRSFDYSPDTVDDIFETVFPAGGLPMLPVHPLLWTLLREDLRKILEASLKAEAQDLKVNGFEPVLIEKELKENLSPPLDEAAWQGRVDRLDASATGIRIVDYKTGRLKPGSVLKDIMEGDKWQAPIYLLLAEQFMKRQGKKLETLMFRYLHVNDEGGMKDFTHDDWVEERPKIIQRIHGFLEQIKAGQFTIRPGDYCAWCDYSAICRKDDPPSRARALRESTE